MDYSPNDGDEQVLLYDVVVAGCSISKENECLLSSLLLIEHVTSRSRQRMRSQKGCFRF